MPTNPKEYANLRTLLDSLEIGALRYYLSGQGASQPQKYKYLEDQLMPIIQQLWHPAQRSAEPLIDCPDGYFDCAGCCVPYKCPDISDVPKPRPRSKSKR